MQNTNLVYRFIRILVHTIILWIHNNCTCSRYTFDLNCTEGWQQSDVLRTVFLQVPTIPNPVGVGRMLELQTLYRKVTRDEVASAYVLHPLKTSFISIYKELRKLDDRQARENVQVENPSQYLSWWNTWSTTVYILEDVAESGDVGTPGVSIFNCSKVIICEKHKVQAK